jgi:type I restriction enzyme S subunit
MAFLKYEKYVDSGIDWLGEVPEGWENYRLNWISGITRGNSSFKKDELLENGEYIALQYGKVYKVDEVDEAFNFYVNSEFYKSDQVVHYGNIILVSTSETIEDLGHACLYNRKDIGLIGGEQILLKPKRKLIFEKYIYYYSKVFCKELRKYSTGLKVFRFNIDDLKNICISIPNKQTQTAIANFLDEKTALIDKKIELLKQKKQKYLEYKQALIAKTITKGLNKNAPLKESEIEWIGKIPSHWGVKRLKDLGLNFETGKLDVNEYDVDGKYPFFTCSREPTTINTYAFDKEALLVAGNGEVGNTIYYKGKFNAYQRVYVLSIFNKIEVGFLGILISNLLTKSLENKKKGSIIDFIKLDFLRNFTTIVPPKSEQTAIANFLDEKTDKINKITANIDKNIEKMQELRKTLINDAVIGKIKII